MQGGAAHPLENVELSRISKNLESSRSVFMIEDMSRQQRLIEKEPTLTLDSLTHQLPANDASNASILINHLSEYDDDVNDLPPKGNTKVSSILQHIPYNFDNKALGMHSKYKIGK